jgi:hypothetical protein
MFKMLGFFIVALVSLAGCRSNEGATQDSSSDQGWTQVLTPSDGDSTYEIQRGQVSYVQNSKGERTIVVEIRRYVKMSKGTDLIKLQVSYVDCQAGHGLIHTSDMGGHLNAVAAFAKGVNTDTGALARAACAAAGVH